MAELSRLAVERLIRKAGAGRVSMKAVDALREAMEDYAVSISRKAVELAEHSGRKTVTDQDIKLALKFSK